MKLTFKTTCYLNISLAKLCFSNTYVIMRIVTKGHVVAAHISKARQISLVAFSSVGLVVENLYINVQNAKAKFCFV